MAKKINEKKKINIKLESGQTYLITTIEEMLQISHALLHYVSIVRDEKEKQNLLKLNNEAIRSMNDNQFISKIIYDDDDNW